jgi:hypothetical protein
MTNIFFSTPKLTTKGTDVDGRAWVLGLNEIETNSAKNALSALIQAINDTIQLS